VGPLLSVMSTQTFGSLADFGTRSLVTHALMGVTFLGAVGSALLLDGQLSLVSFVAFVNFTAGVWICQSIHSLGDAGREDSDYDGVLNALRAR
jgi:hypothetical protein